MYYIVQIASIFFALFSAGHDAVTANHFSDYSETPANLRKFHHSGNRIRIVFLVMPSILIAFNPESWMLNYVLDAIITGLTGFFWIWLVFDPAINKSRHRSFSWDYLGDDDGVSRWLKKWFGRKSAGQWKAALCLLAIGLLNAAYILFT